MKLEFITGSAEDTAKLGINLASFLNGGDTIILTGDLGGGKTTFISGIAHGLGIDQPVSSPSFTLVNEYSSAGKSLIHADLYRLNSAEDIMGIGLEDYIYSQDNIVCIEWGNKMGAYLPPEYLGIHFGYMMDSESKRKIIFNSNTGYWQKKLTKFKNLAQRKGFQ